MTSGLAALHTGCKFHGFVDFWVETTLLSENPDHQKNLELTRILAASKNAQSQLERNPRAPPTADLLSEAEQTKHRLITCPCKVVFQLH